MLFNPLDQLEEGSDACVWLIRLMCQTKNKPHRVWWWSNWQTSEGKSDVVDITLAFTGASGGRDTRRNTNDDKHPPERPVQGVVLPATRGMRLLVGA